MTDIPAFTPVFLLTGFLGSGKTTLLARLLTDPALGDTAVLINEFGEVALDHHLVERIDDATVLLGSGCVCCTVRGELAGMIRDMLSRRTRGLVPPFKRIVIETTGLADPLPVLTTLTADAVLRHHVRLGAVVVTADAVNVARQIAFQPESVKQVAVADRLVLTKADLCDAPAVARAVAAVRAVNHDAPLLVAGVDRLDAAEMFGERPLPGGAGSSSLGLRCDPTSGEAISPHGADLSSFSLVIDEALDWTAFGLWLSALLHRHGDRVLRVKGLLNVAGTEAPVAIHGVQQLVHMPVHLAAWPDEDRRSRIVFITRGLNASTVLRSMRAFGVLALPPKAEAAA